MITIKSTDAGLEFWMKEEGSYSQLRQALMHRLSANRHFYKGFRLPVLFFGKTFSNAQKRELKRFLLDEYDILTVEFIDDEFAQARKPDNVSSHPCKRRLLAGESSDDGRWIRKEKQRDHIFQVGTVRSGQRLSSDGDIVIVGDVNPGAEVVAKGNIAVFGKLRGLAHAGCSGWEKACIISNHLCSKQIRIAGRIAVIPEERTPDSAELVKIEDDKIIVCALD